MNMNQQPDNNLDRGPSAAAKGRFAEREFAGIERRTLGVVKAEYEKLTSEILAIDSHLNKSIEIAIREKDKDKKDMYTEIGKMKMTALVEKRKNLEDLIAEAIGLGGSKEEFKMIPTTH